MERDTYLFVSPFVANSFSARRRYNGVLLRSKGRCHGSAGHKVVMKREGGRHSLTEWMQTWGRGVVVSAVFFMGGVGFAGQVGTIGRAKRVEMGNAGQKAETPSTGRVQLARGLLDSLRLRELPGIQMQKDFSKGTNGMIRGGIEKRQGRTSSSFVTQAVRSVGAAVVRIDTERVVDGGLKMNITDLFDDPTMKKFFDDKFNGHQNHNDKSIERGQGSGFIISSDGLLVTNAHVVKNAQKVTVTLTDGTSYDGVVKGTDDLVDVAVVKIDGKGRQLPVAKLGNSGNMQVGDWVIAVGNPVGLDNTVTLGIVSSLNRSADEVGIPDKRLDFIQTDAAINLGNSGGPLVNEFGEVVGINTCIRANAEGIGFAIPVDRVRRVLTSLAKGEKINHPFFGIHMTSVTPEFARRNNADPNAPAIVPEVEGVFVIRVMPGSPAAEGGLRRYDTILEINNLKVKNSKDAQRIFDSAKVGEWVKLQIIRGGKDEKPFYVSVKTGDFSSMMKKSRSTPPIRARPAVPFPG